MRRFDLSGGVKIKLAEPLRAMILSGVLRGARRLNIPMNGPEARATGCNDRRLTIRSGHQRDVRWTTGSRRRVRT